MSSPAPPTLRRSIVAHLRTRMAVVACTRIALVVGTILSAINQLDTFAGGRYSGWIWVKVAMNYVIPFGVSSAGYIIAARKAHRSPDEPRTSP